MTAKRGHCVMFTRNLVHPQWCTVCGFHYLDHPLPQRPGFALPERFAADLFVHQRGGRQEVPSNFPRLVDSITMGGETVTFTKESPMVAYNQSIRQKKIHEYKLRLPAAGGDVQTAISAAVREMKERFPDKHVAMDSVTVGATDEEIVVYWEEEL